MRVIGVEMNEELLREARAKRLANAEFHQGDLRALPDLGVTADGIWCSFTVEDQELSFSGPASANVLDAWRARFDRMRLLRNFCGGEFEQVRQEFLGCLASTEHRSLATVRCCIATRRA